MQCSLALSQTQWPKKYAKKDFSQADFFFWLSGRSGNAPFKSGGEKTFQPAKSFFSHIQTYCCGPTAFGWGLGWLNAPWLCEWWCSYTWDGHGMVMGVSTGNIPKGGSRYQVWLHQHSQSHGKPLVQCSLARSQTQWPKKYAKKTFHRLIFFSGCLVAVAMLLLSLVDKKLFSLRFFFSHIQSYCCGPTAFGWGLGWLNAPWLCEWWCSYTWDGHGSVHREHPKGGSKYQVWLHQHSPSHGKPLVQCSLALSQMLWIDR